MSPPLSAEIIAEIIHHAAFRPASPALSYDHPYHTHLLANLCSVSRSFYTLAGSLLYRNVTVLKDCTTSHLTHKLLPLLSKIQRIQLLQETNTEDPIDHELYYMDRIANPCWVHSLTVLSVRSSRPGEEHIPWRYLEEAVLGMQNLRSMRLEAAGGTPKLIETISQLQKLKHISCISSSLLCTTTQFHRLNGTRLTSLAVNLCPTDTENTGGLRNLVKSSSESLKTLHLYYWQLSPAVANKHLVGMLQGVASLPNLRNLRLCIGDFSSITQLGKAIDFNTLTSLQLIRKETATSNSVSAILGKLSALNKLSVALTSNEAIDVLKICKGLREIHVAFIRHYRNNVTSLNTPEQLIEAIIKHKRTLKALTLCMRSSGYERAEVIVLREKELERLVKECSGIEDLRINIDADDFIQICNMLPRLHLRNLALDLIIYDGSPLALPITSTITPLSKKWYHPSQSYNNTYEDIPPSQVSPIENALSYLISAFIVYYPDSWRQNTPQFICISSPGIKPDMLSDRYSQAYILYDPSESPKVDDVKKWYQGIRYTAPSGQRFEWENSGTKVHIQVVDTIPSRKDDWNGKLAAWNTAFKSANSATDIKEHVIR